jgi:hypothetical protein
MVHGEAPRALFLAPDGSIFVDSLVCSGVIPAELDGRLCPYSQNGRIPVPVALDPCDPSYTLDKGKPGDLCPPCAKQTLGPVESWIPGAVGRHNELSPRLRLFKCRQWFWLVVPGLYEDTPHSLLQTPEQG